MIGSRAGGFDGQSVATLPAQLRLELLKLVPLLDWRDGKTTARGVASDAKDCEVAHTLGTTAFMTEEAAGLLAATYQHVTTAPAFIDRALPLRLSAFRFMRYRRGGSYGVHTDEALNSQGFRADLSFTILLQDAEAGGQLVVGGEPIAMREGDVFVYPSTTAHGVSTVLEGERIVIVGWVQSMVRDHGQRALLADIHHMAINPAERDAPRLQAVRNELLRRWCG